MEQKPHVRFLTLILPKRIRIHGREDSYSEGSIILVALVGRAIYLVCAKRDIEIEEESFLPGFQTRRITSEKVVILGEDLNIINTVSKDLNSSQIDPFGTSFGMKVMDAVPPRERRIIKKAYMALAA